MRDKIPRACRFLVGHPDLICELNVAADQVDRNLVSLVEDDCLDLGKR
jgi:hypothetical protein